jgi:RNA polymerase sigma factor (sigma-70 family)
MKNTSDTFPEQIHKQENLFEEVVFENWIKDEVTQELLSHLTTREREIYELMFVKALSTKEICEQLQITESTVRNTKKNIMDKIKKDIEDHNFTSV